MAQNQKNEREEKPIDIKKILAIIKKNFIVLSRDKVRLIPLLIFPVVMILVLGSTSGNIPKHIPTAIVLQDNSIMSGQIQQQIQNSEVFSVKRVVSTEGEAKRLLDEGTVRVIVEIPPNLGDDVDSGLQRSITVIVDESDSAVASTAKQTLSGIINNFAHQLAVQKVKSYQEQVDLAGSDLYDYARSDQDKYMQQNALIMKARSSIYIANSITEQNIEILTASLPAPSISVPKTVTNNSALTTNSIYINEPPTADPIHSQIDSLQQAKDNLDSADFALQKSTAAYDQQESAMKAKQAAYEEKVVKSIGTIRMFTHSKTDVLLQPLTYEEKPAYGTGRQVIDFLIPSLIAMTIFQGAVMGMGRAVAGEKRDGSLTRVFLTPTSNTTIISGTLIFFILFELCRATFLIGVAMILFNIKIQGSLALIGLILVIYIAISTGVGMILSSMVKTEGQFMALAMVVSMPTMFLSGAFFPVQSMPKYMQSISAFIPASYASDALRGVMVKGFSLGEILFPIAILLVFLAITLAVLFSVFKRDIE